MSLEACGICGHALAIANSRCRHCRTIAISANWFNTRHVLLSAAAIAVLVLLLYRTFAH